MKKIISLFFLISILSYSQDKVGINTVLPKATIDVNGNLRIKETTEIQKDTKYVLTIDNNNIFTIIDKAKLLDDGGAAVVESRTYAIIPRSKDQQLRNISQYYSVIFDGVPEGINTTNVITLNETMDATHFPPNKAFRVTGSIGLRGSRANIKSTGKPGYIVSKFEAGIGAKSLFSTQGYVESSTESYDDGGVADPIMIFTTGTAGGTISLKVKYAGTVAGTAGYYLAGAPTRDSIGTYILIEEL